MPLTPDYVAEYPQEVFIRRLLKDRIHNLIGAYANISCTSPAVLDVGCGQQPFRLLFEKKGYKYSGMDFRQNQENTVEYVSSIDQPLISELKQRMPFELVICTEVLEHVANWDHAFNNLYALTSEGGNVIITAPHFYQLHEEPFDYWRPTIYAFRYYASKVGFEVVHEERVGNGWDVLGTLIANCEARAQKWCAGDRMVAWLVQRLFHFVFKLLLCGWVQSKVRLLGSLYLSNVVVLKRQSSCTKK